MWDLNVAYGVLKDPEQRANYDRQWRIRDGEAPKEEDFHGHQEDVEAEASKARREIAIYRFDCR